MEKYQAITKDDVLEALRKYFLPLFESSSSVAVVVTAPSKANQIGEDLTDVGFEVEQRSMEINPSEFEEDSESDSGSDSEEMKN